MFWIPFLLAARWCCHLPVSYSSYSRYRWRVLSEGNVRGTIGTGCLIFFLKQFKEWFDDINRHWKDNGRILFGANLGERLKISFQQIQKYERGVDSVRPSKLKLLSELFGCTIHELFYDSNAFPDSDEIITPGRLETAKIRSIIRFFIRIESPALQDHACAIMRTLASTEHQ